jgi:hypothetical protein
MERFTVSLDPELFTLLHDRAKYNRRSMSQEIVFLIEAGLAAGSEGNVEILRMLMTATGGIKSMSVQGDQSPEHIATGESQP